MPKDFSILSRHRSFVFTYNNYPSVEDGHERLRSLGERVIWYKFQEEVGAEGTPHLQGVLGFNNACSISSLCGTDKKRGPLYGLHLEPTKDIYAAIDYCGKDDTRKPGTEPHVFGVPPARRSAGVGGSNQGGIRGIITDEARARLDATIIKPDQLWPWQYGVYRLVRDTTPDTRTIHWYWEPDGNMGKTALTRLLVSEGDTVFLGGKLSDAMAALRSYIEKKKDFPKIGIINIPRDKQNYFSYAMLEVMKDGIAFSGKYESDYIEFTPMHVLVFANFEPNVSTAPISVDRWSIHRVYKHTLDDQTPTQGYLPSPEQLFGYGF